MTRTLLTAAVLLAIGSQSAIAEETLEQRLSRMEAELASLRQQMATQEDTITQQQTTIAEQKAYLEGAPNRLKKLAENMDKKRSDESTAWYRQIEVGGLVEVEAGYHSPYEGDSESDIVLATFELGISSRLGDWVEAGGTLLYEEDDSGLDVDIAYVTLSNLEKAPLFLTAGQVYVPFGAYETNMVSDPLTLEIGETRETALQAGFIAKGFNGSLYVFNGDNNEDGDERIASWGANLAYAQETDALSWAAGLGYISDIGDSDALQDVIGDNLGGQDISDNVPAWTANIGLIAGPFNLIGEYLGASKSFDSAALPWRLNGAEPKAWNLEAGYSFELMGKSMIAAVAYQGSREALALELPRERWLLGLSIDILDNTALSFEWARDKDYSANDGGSGESADTLTAQLAVEF